MSLCLFPTLSACHCRVSIKNTENHPKVPCPDPLQWRNHPLNFCLHRRVADRLLFLCFPLVRPVRGTFPLDLFRSGGSAGPNLNASVRTERRHPPSESKTRVGPGRLYNFTRAPPGGRGIPFPFRNLPRARLRLRRELHSAACFLAYDVRRNRFGFSLAAA
jgi:hypothetical protein